MYNLCNRPGSDLNVARKIWQRSDIFSNKTVLVCGVGCLVFTLLPYIANLCAAIRVNSVVKHNQAAKTWYVSSCR